MSEAPPARDSVTPPTRFGKYLLESRIAVGGSSQVYLARPVTGTTPAPRLVIKRLLPAVREDPQSIGTFALEARLHRAARHPNVVEVYEAGSVDGEPYLAMEYVDGIDAWRLMRRAQADGVAIPFGVATHLAREILAALDCVHCAVDDTGRPLAVVHRDVTPSNVYLSEAGDAKLGDFGIARMLSRASIPTDTSALKGKFSYLSPEQVAGEDFDHRADLFSLAVMLSEMLINQPLFPGSGQLAVLLAIRDCRIHNLVDHSARFPRGLKEVLVRALERDPAQRFGTAHEFSKALEPFEGQDRAALRAQLGALVARARSSMLSLRASRPVTLPEERRARAAAEAADPTQLIHVRDQAGRVLGPMPFARVIELIATSRLQPEDEVDMGGTGHFLQIALVPDLERHVPSSTATTNRLQGPGIPDYVADLAQTDMLHVCARLLLQRETGVLFAEREGRTFIRKEIYLAQARVVHVASSEPSELLGEFLVRIGLITRAALDLALAALPRYGGRLGDTLINLDMVDAVQIYRAIRSQGRERIRDVFRWNTGRVTFYRNVAPHRLEFPLDLDLGPLMFAGAEVSLSDDRALAEHEESQSDLLVGVAEIPENLRLAAWPPEVLKVVGAAGEGRSQSEIIATLKAARLINLPDAVRAIEVACAAGLLRRVKRQG